MSEKTDDDKTRAVLEELEPWAEEEISHLERQFEARGRSVYLPHKIRCRVSFFVGLLCGLIIASAVFWLFVRI